MNASLSRFQGVFKYEFRMQLRRPSLWIFLDSLVSMATL